MKNPVDIQKLDVEGIKLEESSEPIGSNEDPNMCKNQDKPENLYEANNSLSSNKLLHLFVQSKWDQKNGKCIDIHEVKKLENWLESTKIDISQAFWYFSTKLDIRIRSIADVTDSANLEENLKSKDEVICAQLAYSLRKCLPLLISGKGDINYTNDKGQTVLHVLLEESYEITENSAKDKLSKTEKLIEALIEMKASLYALDKNGKTPIHLAIKCQSRPLIQKIIFCLNDISSDENGNTALHILIENCLYEQNNHKIGFVNLARTLVSKGADVNAKNKKGVTPIHLAAEKFHVEMLKLFTVNGGDFTQKTEKDENPLHFACRSKLKLRETAKIIETISLLISQGCDLEAADKDGTMPLHDAAQFGIIEIVEKLIELGANIDCRTTRYLMTPLYLAARKDRLDVMKMLIEAGADINAEAKGGSTPIFMSAMYGKYESLQFLINQGADLYRRDEVTGFTLLHVVTYDLLVDPKVNAAKGTVDNQIDRLEKFKTLIQKNLDVNDSGKYGITPLQLVILVRNTDAVKILMEHHANPNYQSSPLEYTALQLAVIKKHVEIVKVLLDYGADVNCRGGTSQQTALHLALRTSTDMFIGIYPDGIDGHDAKLASPIRKLWIRKPVTFEFRTIDFVTLLIDGGADVNAEDASGDTPLHWATLKINKEILEKIVKSGAHVNVQDNERKLPVHNVLKNEDIKGFKFLLDFGVNINDEDTCEMIINSKGEFKSAAIQHAIKLNIVGLPIAKTYEPLIQSKEFEEFRQKCFEEVKSLIIHCDAGVSLHEFLLMNTKRQRIYVQKISNFNLEDLFPIYSGLIRVACRETENRKSLLNLSRIAWSQIAPFDLTDVCVEEVLSNLNNRYLNVLIGGIKNVEKVTDVEKKRKVFRYSRNLIK